MSTILVWLALLWCVAFGDFSFNSYSQTDLLKIYYISFPSSNSARFSEVDYAYARQNLTLVSRADDSPFEILKLPFDQFVLFGYKADQVYVNANGAVHASYVQPLPYDNVFGPPTNPFDGTYYGVIGGFLTDLNAGNSTNGNITALFASSPTGLSYVSVDFDKICYFGYGNENTFRIVLYEDSSIQFKFDSIYHDNTLPSTWISGLRPPHPNNLTFIDSNQSAFGTSVWKTKVAGVYASKNTVLNNKQFNMCPISMSWCISPSQIYASHTSVTVTLTTLLLSCTDLVDYGIALSLVPQDAGSTIAGNDQYVIKCSATSFAAKPDTFSRLTCVIPASRTTQAIDYYVIPLWRVKTTSASSAYTVLPVGSLSISFVSDTPQSDQCYFNGQTYGYPPSVCSNCEICNFNTTCLDLPCTAHNAVLYEWPSCNGTCSNATDANSTFLVDPANTCCSLNEMDCGGVCHGTQVVSMQDSKSIVCCPRDQVDCAGICKGHTPVDACGECRGPDYTGVTCFAYYRVGVTTGTLNNTLNAVFNTSLAGAALTFYVNITNESNATVVFDFVIENEDKTQAPNITLPRKQVLKINESMLNIPILVSLEQLFAGNQTRWAGKTISVNYYREVYTAKVYTVDIPVYPSTVGCGSITDNRVVSRTNSKGTTESDLCLRLPGCMYCLKNSNIRILRGIEDSEDSTSGGSVARRLFTYLLPNEAVNNDDHLLDGYCIDGFSVDACTEDMAALRSYGLKSIKLSLAQYCAIMLIVFIVLM